LATQVQRINMVVRGLQQQRPPEAIVSGVVERWGVSRRQAYRYLLQGRSRLELRPVPEAKAVLTVSLPQPLLRALRRRCRQQQKPVRWVVAEILQQWLEQSSAHG
jgi:hypothetical protein